MDKKSFGRIFAVILILSFIVGALPIRSEANGKAIRKFLGLQTRQDKLEEQQEAIHQALTRKYALIRVTQANIDKKLAKYNRQDVKADAILDQIRGLGRNPNQAEYDRLREKFDKYENKKNRLNGEIATLSGELAKYNEQHSQLLNQLAVVNRQLAGM